MMGYPTFEIGDYVQNKRSEWRPLREGEVYVVETKNNCRDLKLRLHGCKIEDRFFWTTNSLSMEKVPPPSKNATNKQQLKSPSSNWLTTAEAAAELNISTKHLLKLRAEGIFKIGKHWRDVRGKYAARPTYRWHLENCEKALGVGAEFR